MMERTISGCTGYHPSQSAKRSLIHHEECVEDTYCHKCAQEEITRTGFQKVVAANLQNELSSKLPKSAFTNLRDVVKKHQPRMAVVTMGVSETDTNKTVSASSKDIRSVTMQEFHESQSDQKTQHTMLVGHVGASKSLTAKKYARAVANGDIEVLRHIEMVHYIDASTLQVQQNSNAFELLFIQQIGDALTPELQEEGRQWMKLNARKVLLVIDGLDRTIEEFDCKGSGKIDSETKARTNSILENLFSGSIYKGMTILSTSRPRTYWNMESKQRPQKVIALRGFSDHSINEIISALAPHKAQNIMHRLKNTPQLRSLCKNPMFLIYTTQTLACYKETPETESAVLAAVLQQYSSSGHSDADIDVVMKLAYHGIKDNQYTFTVRYVEKLGISMDELKGPISVGAVLTPFQDKPDKHDLRFQFAHQSIQEVMAAMYPFTFLQKQFVNYAKYDLDKPGMDMALKMLCGIVWNPETQKLARKYIHDRNCDVPFWRETLRDYLMGHICCGTLKNGRVASAIYECGPGFLKQFATLIQRIDLDWKESIYPHSLLSVISYFSSLKEVHLRKIEVTAHLMPLLAQSVAKVYKFKVRHLVLCGPMCSKCFQLLGQVVKNAIVSAVEFDSCQLDVNKVDAYWSEIGDDLKNILPSSDFWMRILNDSEMNSSCIVRLVEVATQRNNSWITFCDCGVYGDKLNALHVALKSSSRKLGYLELLEKNLQPEVHDVRNVCNILQFVETQMQLGDWNLNEIDIDGLRKSMNEYKNLKFGLVLTLNGRTESLKRGARGFPGIFTKSIQRETFESVSRGTANQCCPILGNNNSELHGIDCCPTKILKTECSDESAKNEKEEILSICTTDFKTLRSHGSSSFIRVRAGNAAKIEVQIFAQTVVKDNAKAMFNVGPEKARLEFEANHHG